MSPAPAKVDAATVEAVRRHWDDGWNRGDVDVIMAPFAEDVVFTSPYIPVVGGDPTCTEIVGRDALRTYVSDALVRSPGIRYTVDATHVGTDSVVLVYRCHYPDGRPDMAGVDSMQIDGDGLIADGRCHY